MTLHPEHMPGCPIHPCFCGLDLLMEEEAPARLRRPAAPLDTPLSRDAVVEWMTNILRLHDRLDEEMRALIALVENER